MSERPVLPTDQTLSESRLPRSAPPAGDITTTRPIVGSQVDAQQRLGRFEVLGEIGRGGMGAVLRGHDPALGRELALKVLLAERQNDAAARRRFQEEAQIGGRLQHPSLVPVYELGTDAEGRPFFAMKLVDGRTLAALLRARSHPSEDLPRFLTIFEQACQAIAYAHSVGIIHRDLKPANVMVGAFGEVQVMDWGLAKTVRSSECGMRTGPCTPNSADHTADGSVLGTPAYIPPEQARGESDKVDSRADVFGLGGILCEILTGKPPYIGAHVSDTLALAMRGDVSETMTRLDRCGADTELIALARECLAAQPEERPPDGAAVATRIAIYRAGVAERLRRTELERVAAETRAVEERRRRRTQLLLAIVVLLFLALGGGGTWLVHQQKMDRQQAAERKQRDLEQAVERDLAEVAERQALAKWPEAWAALERGEGRLGEGGPEALRARVADSRRKLEQGRADRQMLARLEEAMVQRVSIRSQAPADATFRDAYKAYGVNIEDPEGAVAFIQASAIRENLVAMLYQWVTEIARSRKDEAVGVARIGLAADPDPWRRQLVEAAIREDGPALMDLLARVDAAKLSPTSAILVAECYQLVGKSAQALPVLQEVRRRNPDDFLLNFAVATYFLNFAQPPQPDEAVRFFTAAIALRPGASGAYVMLGRAFERLYRTEEAIAVYRRLCEIDPDLAEARAPLALALREQGRLAEAEAVSREALRIKTDLPDAHNALRVVLREQGKVAESEAACRDYLKRHPGDARAHCSLGFALRLQGKIAASADEIRLGHELAMKTGWRGPTAQWLREADRLVVLERRLPDVLAGKANPADMAEQREFANLSGLMGRYADAARLYTGAAGAGQFVDAARCAVLAAVKADDGNEQSRLRGLALAWLRDELAALDKRLNDGKPEDRIAVEARSRLLQHNVDLANVREAVDKLPESERAGWNKLWQDVADLQRRAMTPR